MSMCGSPTFAADEMLRGAIALATIGLPGGALAIQLGRALLEEGRRPDVIPAMRAVSSSAWSDRLRRLVPSGQRLRRIGGGVMILLGGLVGICPLTIVLNQMVATPILLAFGVSAKPWPL